LVVISDSKTEVLHYFGDGSELPLPLAYLHRAQPRGLADAVDAGYRWIADADSYTCLALPDTIFQPMTALATIREHIIAAAADVVLGMFPTEHPEQLGPVRLDATGRAVEVLEKPSHTDLYNTWGVAVWSPRFTTFLHHFLASNAVRPGQPDLSVSQVFNAAIGEGYDVRGIFFEDGAYLDVGTAEGIASLLLPAHLATGVLVR
jgi:glucose-1-phosphate thymidylyltransferase